MKVYFPSLFRCLRRPIQRQPGGLILFASPLSGSRISPFQAPDGFMSKLHNRRPFLNAIYGSTKFVYIPRFIDHCRGVVSSQNTEE